MAQTNAFNVVEATIEDIHTGYKSGTLTCRQLVQMYLDRIEAFDKKGPNINALITINAEALKEADRLDAAYKASGPVGPLHGIPVIVKDQADVKGMPTTLGSLLFKDYFPDRDSFVAEKLRKAGAVILGKATLGELGGGDTHGSLFGSTATLTTSSVPSADPRAAPPHRCRRISRPSPSARKGWLDPPTVDLERHRRHAPSAGLVSRGGVYGCWPEIFGSLGPMARSVTDLAKLLDVMVGYDPEDPITARGVGHIPETFTKFLEQRRPQRRAPGHLARVDRPQRRTRIGRLQKSHRSLRQSHQRAESRRRRDRRSHRHSEDQRAARQTLRRSGRHGSVV